MINLFNSEHRILADLSQAFFESIKEELVSRIDSEKKALNKHVTSSGIGLGDYLARNIEKIITTDLQKLVNEVHPELEDLFEKNYQNGPDKKPLPFKVSIDHIFFFESPEKWKPYNLARQLGVHCCPYCNRTYITTLGEDKAKFSRPDFDHFLPKSVYPYFRLSFFNLIPSCVICNRNAKGRKTTSLKNNIYPYSEGFGDKARFTYYPKTYQDLIGQGRPEVGFLFLGSDEHKQKCENNIALFRLKEQYSVHTYELNHLIKLRLLYSVDYIDELMRKYPDLLKSREEAYKMAFGREFELAQDEKRPLSKFTRDILRDLGMLNTLGEE